MKKIIFDTQIIGLLVVFPLVVILQLSRPPAHSNVSTNSLTSLHKYQLNVTVSGLQKTTAAVN